MVASARSDGRSPAPARDGCLRSASGLARRLQRRRRLAARASGLLMVSAPLSSPRAVADGFFSDPLAAADPELAAAVDAELARQQSQIELIASENIVSRAVLEAQGSVLTNKYAEGYPGRRYYGGCEFVDVAESLAIDRAKRLFGCAFANVQPHSGAQANQAVFLALLAPGDTILGHVARRRRPPDPRRAAEPVGQMVQRALLWRAARGCAHRFRRGRAAGAHASAQADHRRRQRLSADHRFRPLSRDRRRGRRLSDGRHGAFRRARRRRRASEPVAACPCRDHDDAQDPARAARRADPRPKTRRSAGGSTPRSFPGCRAAR